MPAEVTRVRSAAGRKLLLSSWLLLVIPAVAYLTEVAREIQPITQFLVFAAAFLCTPFLVHLLELITGVPFMDLSHRWNGLKGWQRGVIGATGCAFLLTLLILMMGTALPLVSP